MYNFPASLPSSPPIFLIYPIYSPLLLSSTSTSSTLPCFSLSSLLRHVLPSLSRVHPAPPFRLPLPIRLSVHLGVRLLRLSIFPEVYSRCILTALTRYHNRRFCEGSLCALAARTSRSDLETSPSSITTAQRDINASHRRPRRLSFPPNYPVTKDVQHGDSVSRFPLTSGPCTWLI